MHWHIIWPDSVGAEVDLEQDTVLVFDKLRDALDEVHDHFLDCAIQGELPPHIIVINCDLIGGWCEEEPNGTPPPKPD